MSTRARSSRGELLRRQRALLRKVRRRRAARPELRVDRVSLERDLLRDHFFTFLQRFWPVVETAAPVWNWHIEAICDELQALALDVAAGRPRRHDLLVNVPPGSTKSLICSVMFPAWVWTFMPHAQFICASYADELALKLSLKCRDVVESDKWKELFGEIKLRADQKAKGHFQNVHKGWRFALGTNGSVTGTHGHFLIIDDPVDPNRAFSKAELKSANRWVSETLSRRKVNSKVSVTVLVMQRLHQNDPAAVMLEKAKRKQERRRARGSDVAPVRHVNLPAEVHGDGFDAVRPRRLASHYVDDPDKPGWRLLDPVRADRDVLEDARIDLGDDGYAGQMLQVPVPPGGSKFKVERLVYEDLPPRDNELVDVVRYWDKAGTLDGGAWTVGAKLATDRQGNTWVLDVVRGQWDSFYREDVIHRTAQRDGVEVRVGVEQEPGSGGKESAQATTRRLRGFRVTADRPTGDKEVRADPFSIQVNAGFVHVVRGAWNAAYVDELTYFPKSQYMDQVDASSGAFGMLARPRVRVGGLGWGPKGPPERGGRSSSARPAAQDAARQAPPVPRSPEGAGIKRRAAGRA